VGRRVRVEIRGKDEFWRHAFNVEWGHQFPGREMAPDGAGHLLAEAEWLEDLERVAAQTFCRVMLAPENRHRREWLSSIIARRGR
jgi:hypothetical protein